MNDNYRQKAIDAVQEDDQLTPGEKETGIHFTKPMDTARITTAIGSLMKRLLAHPDFEIDFINQRNGDGQIVKVDWEDFEEEFDGRRRVVSVTGDLDIGALKIPSGARQRKSIADIVSPKASDLRLSQRDEGGDGDD